MSALRYVPQQSGGRHSTNRTASYFIPCLSYLPASLSSGVHGITGGLGSMLFGPETDEFRFAFAVGFFFFFFC